MKQLISLGFRVQLNGIGGESEREGLVFNLCKQKCGCLFEFGNADLSN